MVEEDETNHRAAGAGLAPPTRLALPPPHDLVSQCVNTAAGENIFHCPTHRAFVRINELMCIKHYEPLK